jgi:hypothetical protein
MNHKFIYLPSNSNSFNTTTEFTTQFSEPLNLKNNSKVALVEVIYKHSWNVSMLLGCESVLNVSWKKTNAKAVFCMAYTFG